MSARLRLTLSYAAFLAVAGAVLLAIVWVFLLRYVPPGAVRTMGGFVPGRDDLIRAFAPKAGWAFLFLLVFGLAGGWLLAGRMLAPLNRITKATRKAATGSLSHRIEMEGPLDEFRELADAFDNMLARLEAQVAEQQRFAANASHELRTPLAITQTLLEVACNDPGHDRSELIERLLLVNARSIDLTEALLTLSRSDQRAFQRDRVDLSLVADEAVETLLPLAEKHGVEVGVSGGVAPTLGSHALLLQMTTNLLHNAIVHNLGEDGRVYVHTAVEPQAAVLTVESTGESLSPRLVSTLTEPFQRGPGRIRSGHSGVGLGLAIVKSVCRAHDGELSLAAREGGGLVVTARLPLAAGFGSPAGTSGGDGELVGAGTASKSEGA